MPAYCQLMAESKCSGVAVELKLEPWPKDKQLAVTTGCRRLPNSAFEAVFLHLHQCTAGAHAIHNVVHDDANT